MTNVVPLKVGEILVPIKGSSWDLTGYTQAELISSATIHGAEQWWCKVIGKNGTTMTTFSTRLLRRGWVRRERFFKIGSTYKFNNRVTSDTYKILDVYEIENPLYSSNATSAFAVAKDRMTGRQYGISLSGSDFDIMVKV